VVDDNDLAIQLKIRKCIEDIKGASLPEDRWRRIPVFSHESLDSLQAVELVIALELHFHAIDVSADIPEEAFETISELASAVLQRLQENEG
jgi:acyl carrier protein